MNNTDRINYLVNQCLQQKETAEERAELLGLMTDDSVRPELENILLEAFYRPKPIQQLPRETRSHMLDAIISSTSYVKEPFMRRIRRWTSAAAIVLILFIPFTLQREENPLLQYTFQKAPVADLPRDTVAAPMKPVASTDAAVLQLVDGTRLYLPSLAIGAKISKNGLMIEKSGQDELVLSYDLQTRRTDLTNAFHTIKTPNGSKYSIQLPDGSRVQLNSASKLVFPHNFTDSTRYVQLSGEAYFEVVRDTKTFIVYSEQGDLRQEVIVYGTAFNIAAYPNDEQLETTLVQGAVNISNLNNNRILPLKPNERIVFGRRGMEKQKANLVKDLAWLNNEFYFEEEPLHEALREISRWYDVEFKNMEKLPTQKLWAQVSRNTPLVDLLTMIGKTHALQFNIVGKEVYLVD